jgi:hypothetical protein
VELGSYEKCQDLRALLKRKHRFILLRSPGNKVGRCPCCQPLQARLCLRGSLWGSRQAGPLKQPAGSLLSGLRLNPSNCHRVGPSAHFVLEVSQSLDGGR